MPTKRDTVTVPLVAPHRHAGRRRSAGESITVRRGLLPALERMGVIAPGSAHTRPVAGASDTSGAGTAETSGEGGDHSEPASGGTDDGAPVDDADGEGGADDAADGDD